MTISMLINPCNSSIESSSVLDMTGNTDWIIQDIEDSIAEILLGDMSRDEHGAAMYKWKDNTVVERTEEERKKEWSEPIIEASIEDYENALHSLGVIK